MVRDSRVVAFLPANRPRPFSVSRLSLLALSLSQPPRSVALLSLGAGLYVYYSGTPSLGLGSSSSSPSASSASAGIRGERSGFEIVLGAACRAKPGAADAERYGPGKEEAPPRWCSALG
jgi:hypothetical protein